MIGSNWSLLVFKGIIGWPRSAFFGQKCLCWHRMLYRSCKCLRKACFSDVIRRCIPRARALMRSLACSHMPKRSESGCTGGRERKHKWLSSTMVLMITVSRVMGVSPRWITSARPVRLCGKPPSGRAVWSPNTEASMGMCELMSSQTDLRRSLFSHPVTGR